MNNHCASSCSNPEHYSLDQKGSCVLKEDCVSRKVIEGNDYPCGDLCFKDINSVVGQSCVSSCSNNAHYTNISGVCTDTLIEICSERKINSSNRGERKYVCGSEDCYQNINSKNGDSCVSSCGDNSKGIEGICIICEDITVSDVDSCLGGNLNTCYYKSGLSKCVSNCGKYYSGNNGVCEVNTDCFLVDNKALTCSLIPDCDYKAGSDECVTTCGPSYSEVDGICTSEG
jgi:hypothetical protein